MKHILRVSLFVTTCMLFNLISYSKDTISRKKIDSPLHTITANKQIFPKETSTKKNDDLSWFNRSPTNGSALISSTVVLTLGILAFCQWKKDQGWKRQDALAKQNEANWRRKEAVFKRIDTLSATPGTWNAILMLNSSDRKIPLWDKSNVEQRYERVNRKEVTLALLPPTILDYVISEKESAIRDCFNDFLNRLSHAEALLSDGETLVQKKDMLTFMEPIIQIFKCLVESSKPVDKELLRNFHLFIEYKNLKSVIRLFDKFDIFIPDHTRVENWKQEVAIECKAGLKRIEDSVEKYQAQKKIIIRRNFTIKRR